MIPDLIIVTGMESVGKTGVETTFEVIAKSGNGVVEAAIAVGVELETSVVFRVENAACLEAEIKAGPGFYRVKGSAFDDGFRGFAGKGRASGDEK